MLYGASIVILKGSEFPPNPCGYYSFGIIGDTIINSITYHKIYVLGDTTLNVVNSKYYGAIREDSIKKIHFIKYNCNNEEIILYDFSKNVNDNFKTKIGYEWCEIPEGIHNETIKSVDTVLIDNEFRKKINLYTSYNDDNWIQGIGSLNDLFYPINTLRITTCICSWELVCFKQDDKVLYLNPQYNSCFPTVGINEIIKKNNSFSIFPNPVSEISLIKWNETNQFTKLEIFDVLGRTIQKIRVVNVKSITINKNLFNEGIYFIILSDRKGNNYTGKFIIL